MTIQFLKKNGRKVFAVLPYREFLRMKKRLEDYADLVASRKDNYLRKHP